MTQLICEHSKDSNEPVNIIKIKLFSHNVFGFIAHQDYFTHFEPNQLYIPY